MTLILSLPVSATVLSRLPRARRSWSTPGWVRQDARAFSSDGRGGQDRGPERGDPSSPLHGAGATVTATGCAPDAASFQGARS
jgi:hypothetical protein